MADDGGSMYRAHISMTSWKADGAIEDQVGTWTQHLFDTPPLCRNFGQGRSCCAHLLKHMG